MLQSTCTCPGGVDNTQRMVANALYHREDMFRKSVTVEQHADIWKKKVMRAQGNSRGLMRANTDKGGGVNAFGFVAIPQHNQSNQVMKKYHSVLISIKLDKGYKRKEVWSDKKIYFPANGDMSSVKGHTLLSDGVPNLMFSWFALSSGQDDYSMLTLFGCVNEVPFRFLCNFSDWTSTPLKGRGSAYKANDVVKKQISDMNTLPLRRGSVIQNKRKLSMGIKGPIRKMKRNLSARSKTLLERKKQVADYFVAQMYLVADLCLDRNYVAIELLERLYSFEMLLSILKSKFAPSQFKAPVCRVIRCLYVDREPQVEAKFPRLVKTTAALKGKQVSTFQDFHNGNPHCFGLLQLIISDYFHDVFDASNCNELSAEMVDLLLDLIRFGFYSTPEQLQDIINPLVDALDQHRCHYITSIKAVPREDDTTDFEENGLSMQQVVAASVAAASARKQSGKNISFSIPSAPFLESSRSPSFMNKRIAPEGSSDDVATAALVRRASVNGLGGAAKKITDKDDTKKSKVKDKMEVDDNENIERRILRYLESFKVLSFVLILVVITTVISAMELIEPSKINGEAWIAFDIAVSIFFMTELAVRVSCYYIVHKELRSFSRSPLNVLDMMVVTLDLALLVIHSPGLKGASNLAQALKIFRILRLIRFMRAARVLKRIADSTKVTSNWTMPARYAATTDNEVRTLAGMLKVISIVHDRIQDRKLTTAFNAFVCWYDMESQGRKGRDAMDTYKATMRADASWAAFIPAKFDDALLDIVMYSDPLLVQEALHLLMVHRSDEQRLREAMSRVQIISHPEVGAKYKEICSYVKLMKQHAEAFEIWGEFNTDEDDRVANELYTIMRRISELLKINATTKLVDFEPPHTEDPEIQKVLANLGAMDELMTVQAALLDVSLGEPHPMVVKIIHACNELIGDFVKNSHENQKIAFAHLTWFLERVDDGIMSSKVVRRILTGNSFLIKQCQRKHLTEFMQKIIMNGRKCEYLDLFVGMTDIADTGDNGVAAVRSEIARHLTNVDRSHQILLWCCSPGSSAYKERQRAMEPFLATDPVSSFDDFTPDLRYHINLVLLLAGCKLGPKLQAIYALDDVVYAILDNTTIFAVRKTLGLLLLESTETRVDGMESSEMMWKFFVKTCDFFEKAAMDLPLWLRTTSAAELRQANSEWMHICCRITAEFFAGFDFAVFYEAMTYQSEYSFKTTSRSEADINEIMLRLGLALRHLLEKHDHFLGTSCKEGLKAALSTLSQIHGELAIDDTKADLNLRIKRRSQVNRQNSLGDDVQQAFYRKQYAIFLSGIAVSDDCLRESAMTTFEKIPLIADSVQSDVRLEPFLLKLTTHIRTQIEKTSSSSTLNKSVTTATVWLLRTLRLILEKSMECSIEQLCNPSCTRDLLEVSWFHDIFNTTGVTFLCLDLIAIGIEVSISVEAAKMVAVMCAKSGGNIVVQRTIYRYLSETDSTLFFEQIKDILEMQMLWCQRFAENEEFYIDEPNQTAALPEALVFLKMTQLICDGNFVSTKLFLKEQEGNSRFVNVLDTIATFADVLSRLESHNCTQVTLRIMDTFLGLLQGPSVTCQEHFVLHTDLLVALNRLMRSSRPSQDFSAQWRADIDVLKEYVIDVLRACIEGLPEGSVVVERVQTAIEVNVLNVLIIPSVTDEYGVSINVKELTRLQAKYLVFLRTLNDKNAEMPPNALARIEEDTASIEVVWEQKLYRHYFHIPEIAQDLSQSSKAIIIEQMNCISQECKLKDFIKHVRDLYREAVHQQTLKSYGISNVWHFVGTLSWVMFANVIAMNILLTAYYVQGPHGGILLPNHISDVLFALNVIHIVFSSIILVVAIIVRVPVSYSAYRAKGHGAAVAFLRAITGKLPLWYFCYLAVSVLALLRSYLFLSVLLLDFIVSDSTSRDVLYAVVIPARQLLSTFIMMVVALYITAVLVFVYFRTDYQHFTDENDSMFDSVLLAFTFGIRATEGLGQVMFDSTGNRIILDVVIYFVIVVILRNIFFGIIINSFGELRNVKQEREEHVSNRCFICGIDRHEFDKRLTNDTSDFRIHRAVTHNMWNYLYFVMRIWQQPRSQDNSLEMYVRQCIESNDVSWFPIGLIGINECDADSTVTQGISADEEVIDAVNDDSRKTMARSSSLMVESPRKVNSAADNRALMLDYRLNLIQRKLTDMSTSVSLSPTTALQFSFGSEVEGKGSSLQEQVEVIVKNKLTSLQQKMLTLRNTIISANKRFDEIESDMAQKKIKLTRSESGPKKSLGPPACWLPVTNASSFEAAAAGDT